MSRNVGVMLVVVAGLFGACCSTPEGAGKTGEERTGSEKIGAASGGLCPDNAALRLAYNLEVAPGKQVNYLHVKLLEDTVGWADEEPPPFAQKPLDAAAAAQLGVKDDKAPVWVLGADEPCQMTPGALLQLDLYHGGPKYSTIVQELEGSCPGLKPHGEVVVVQQAEAPASCRFLKPKNLGEGVAPPVALPEAVTTALDPGTCKEPGCQQQRITRVGATPSGAALVQLHATRYNVRPDEENAPDCESVQLIHDGWVRLSADAPWVRWETYWADVGLVYDTRGVRAITWAFLGHFDVGTVAEGEVRSEREERWAAYHEEDGADDMNPCGL